MFMSRGGGGGGGKICYNFYLQRERSWFRRQGYVTTIGKIIYMYNVIHFVAQRSSFVRERGEKYVWNTRRGR